MLVLAALLLLALPLLLTFAAFVAELTERSHQLARTDTARLYFNPGSPEVKPTGNDEQIHQIFLHMLLFAFLIHFQILLRVSYYRFSSNL